MLKTISIEISLRSVVFTSGTFPTAAAGPAASEGDRQAGLGRPRELPARSLRYGGAVGGRHTAGASPAPLCKLPRVWRDAAQADHGHCPPLALQATAYAGTEAGAPYAAVLAPPCARQTHTVARSPLGAR